MDTFDTSSVAVEASKVIDKISTMDAQSRMSYLWDSFMNFAPKLLTAILVSVVGVILVRMLMSLGRKLLVKSKLDPTLHKFTLSILSVTLYIILGVIVLAVLVPSAVASLIAVLGVFGLAVSLAVKDSLANLAGGLSVLFTKPFALNDYVKINNNEGSIQEIRLNYTVMKTFDNKVIHIPNGDVAKAQIINYTCEPTRRLDLVFNISYHDSFPQAQSIIRKLVEAHPWALKDPEPVVRMIGHGESAIQIGCRVWCSTSDYWPLQFDLLEQVKEEFDIAGITIPFNRMDVTLIQPNHSQTKISAD